MRAPDQISPGKPRGRLTAGRLGLTLMVLSLVVVILIVFSTAIGSEHVSLDAIIKIVTGRAAEVTPEERVIISGIRLPRVLMAVVVGAALSVAGAAYQALLRNPLADPYVLGVSTGGALGAIAATVFTESIQVSRPLAAFVGATLTIAVVYALGQSKRGGSTERLILAGVIVNALLSSAVIFMVTAASGIRQRSVLSWLIGDL
ncbi:MAG TPA: iron chelate uptake ABC transporter family permease subunit, partial [Blastocatellia bacterium]|nr:iron chelate uptake ABC transporter family permease subunit [Blastocatellia bacterium]